jgi:hypothetical protein
VETPLFLTSESSFEGENPRSAVGVSNSDWDSKGGNRHEGNQTLKTERRQLGKLPDQWTFESDVCCRERKVQERSRSAVADGLGSAASTLWRKAELARVDSGASASESPSSWENHTAEETANSIVGS